MTLLDPVNFWSRVPPNFKSIYTFFNSPAHADPNHPDCPLNIIKNVATAEDFVSFKLDIDTPSVEMPIAMEILKNPAITELVDEFFFEMHFRCELMMFCGWFQGMPEEINGVKFDRTFALDYFTNLRVNGVRAHFWP